MKIPLKSTKMAFSNAKQKQIFVKFTSIVSLSYQCAE